MLEFLKDSSSIPNRIPTTHFTTPSHEFYLSQLESQSEPLPRRREEEWGNHTLLLSSSSSRMPTYGHITPRALVMYPTSSAVCLLPSSPLLEVGSWIINHYLCYTLAYLLGFDQQLEIGEQWHIFSERKIITSYQGSTIKHLSIIYLPYKTIYPPEKHSIAE